MSDPVTIPLCILWEDELRKASSLLRLAQTLPEDDDRLLQAQQAAWAACCVALHGLTDDAALVLLSNSEIRRPRKGSNAEAHAKNRREENHDE